METNLSGKVSQPRAECRRLQETKIPAQGEIRENWTVLRGTGGGNDDSVQLLSEFNGF
jgi:hypothetical protein